MMDVMVMIACFVTGFASGVIVCMESMGKRNTDMIKRMSKKESRDDI